MGIILVSVCIVTGEIMEAFFYNLGEKTKQNTKTQEDTK